jgi:hypothetical protein
MENGEKVTWVKWNKSGGRQILAVEAKKNKVRFVEPQFGRSDLDLREYPAGPTTV